MNYQTEIEDTVMTKDEFLSLISDVDNIKEREFSLDSGSVAFELVTDSDDQESIQFRLSGDKFKLKPDAGMQAFTTAKITQSLTKVYDRELHILPMINYYYNNTVAEQKALIDTSGSVLAFMKTSTEIYSLHNMVSEMCRAVEAQGVTNIEFHKVSHTFDETSFCMVFPDEVYDVGNGDVLVAGIHVQHSVLGKFPTIISTYVSRSVHDNGMISQRVFAKWDRRLSMKGTADPDSNEAKSGYDIYTWCFDEADSTWRYFRREAETVKNLQAISVGGHAGTILNDVFTKYSIPTKAQSLIREEFADQLGNTMYDLWNAISLTADREELEENPNMVKKLMNVAGQLAAHPDSCRECHRFVENIV